MYLIVASDNIAQTAFTAFNIGVQKYGIPERVRTDKGMKYVEIASFMLQSRGIEYHAQVTGRSVHNQRYLAKFLLELVCNILTI